VFLFTEIIERIENNHACLMGYNLSKDAVIYRGYIGSEESLIVVIYWDIFFCFWLWWWAHCHHQFEWFLRGTIPAVI